MAFYIIFGVIVLIALVVALSGSTTMPSLYQTRKCQGKVWREAFPGASSEQIRKFLETFSFSFAFKSKDKFKFRPNDKILGIYQALYPKTSWGVDALEVETLFEEMELQYGIHLDSVWKQDLTLGELFSLCLDASLK